ncbi:uncharacterized protein isoform X2 [Takifugu rubripes]|uniref:uncharacterized protein isoform X2 n=1 Tax=Takifugu rubripes TaxID=31033 RepID=UPI0011460386|nr:uncharacterized protein LOC101072077 isoform X2 [Takifugu rubripes]
MWRSKVEVDRYVSSVQSFYPSLKEKSKEGFSFAKLYFEVKEYELAKRYVLDHLKIYVRDYKAHKFLGQLFEREGEINKAVRCYKRSVGLNPAQKDLVLKVAELLVSKQECDSTAPFWVEKAAKLHPGHPAVFNLKECLSHQGQQSWNQLYLLQAEMTARPADAHVNVKLVQLLNEDGRLEEAVKHCLATEKRGMLRHSLEWYTVVLHTLQEYLAQPSVSCNEKMCRPLQRELLLAHCSLLRITLSDSSMQPSLDALKSFDESMHTLSRVAGRYTDDLFEMFMEMRGHLYLHAGTLLLKLAQDRQQTWMSVSDLAALCYLLAYQVQRPKSKMTKRDQSCLQLLELLANDRQSQAGHMLFSLSTNATTLIGEVVEAVGNRSGQDSLFELLYGPHASTASSFIANDDIHTINPVTPDLLHLAKCDSGSILLHGGDLQHLTWLGLQWTLRSQRPEMRRWLKQLFPLHNLETSKLDSSAPESICLLDLEVFLYGVVFCCHCQLQETAKISGGMNEQQQQLYQPRCLPVPLLRLLTTGRQREWWNAIYSLIHGQAVSGTSAKLRMIVQHGLNTLRGGEKHGLQPAMLIHWAQSLSQMGDGVNSYYDRKEYIGRSVHYWKVVHPLLERVKNRRGIPEPLDPLFLHFPSKDIQISAVKGYKKEAKVAYATLLDIEGKTEEAIATLETVNTMSSVWHLAQIYQRLSKKASNGREETQDRCVTLLRNFQTYLLKMYNANADDIDKIPISMEEIVDLLSDVNHQLVESGGTIDEQDDEGQKGPAHSSPAHPNETSTAISHLKFSTPSPNKSIVSPTKRHLISPKTPPHWVEDQKSLVQMLCQQVEALKKEVHDLRQSASVNAGSPHHKMYGDSYGAEGLQETFNPVQSYHGAPQTGNVQFWFSFPLVQHPKNMEGTKHSEILLDLLTSDIPAKNDTATDSSAVKEKQPSQSGIFTFGSTGTGNISGKTENLFKCGEVSKPAFGIPKSPAGEEKTPESDNDNTHVEEDEDGPHFEPIVPLPDKVDVKTGEEEEEEMFCNRAKLYRFDTETKEWKVRGIGNVKILKHSTKGKVRLLMRREQVRKICANHYITSDMILKPNASSDKSWVWNALDYADEEPKTEQLAIRFKTVDEASLFKAKFEEAKKVVLQSPEKAKPQEKKEETLSASESLAARFALKEGEWECSVCCVRNKSTDERCVACQTANPDPSAKPEKQHIPDTKASPFTFKFGIDSSNPSGFTALGASIPPATFTFSTTKPLDPVSVGFGFGFQSSEDFQFGQKDPNFKGFSGAGDQLFSSLPATPTKTDGSNELEDDGMYKTEEHADIQFEPVVQMPDKVDLVTGEEDEEVLYSERVELFRFDSSVSQWKERGVGILKILKNPTNGRFRVLMRRDRSLKVRTNHWITTTMNLEPLACSDRAWMWMANDFSGGDPKPEQLAAEFKSPEVAEEFKLKFEECQKLLLDIPLQTPHKLIDSDRKAHLIWKAEEIKSGFKDLVTGEDDEEVVYSKRVRLFRFDSTVNRKKVCGVGILKILKNPTNGRFRLLMRRDQGLKVCANHWITSTMNLKPLACSDRDWMLMENDFSDGDTKLEELAAQFKSPEAAEKFKLKFEECQKLLLDIPLQTPHKSIDSGRTAHLIQKAEEMKSGLKDLNFFLTDDKTKITDDDSQEDVDASISAPSLVMAQGETTGPKLECDNYDLRKEALDDTADSSIYASPLSSSPQRKNVVRSGESTGGFSVTFQPGISPSKSPTELNQSRASVGTDDKQDTTQEEERDGQYFEPVVQMPDKVDLVTGGEDEEVLYSERVELFRFDSSVSQWKKRGVGILKILKNPTNGRFRVLMRRDWSLKVRANHWITTTMNLKPLAGSDRAWMWMANDFSDGDAKPEQLAAEFKSPEFAEEFMLTIEECQKLLLDIPLQNPHKSIDSGRTAHLIQKAEEMKSGLKDLKFFLTDDKTKIKDDDSQKDVGASISAPSLVMAQGETTDLTMEWDNYDLRKEALDDTADSSIYDSPLFSGPPRKKVCRFRESTGGFSVTFQPGISPSKSPTELNQSRASVGTDDKQDTTQEEERDGQYFEPVVQMPDKVDLVTGGEDEEVLYSERVELFRFDSSVSQWKKRGVGVLKILKNPTNGRFRVLMRRDWSLKVRANHWITTTMNLKPLAGSDKAWMWMANDFSDGDAKPEQLAAEFKSPEFAEEFMLTIEECQKLLLDIPLQTPHKSIDSGRTAHLIQKAEEMKSGLKDLNFFLTDDKTKIKDDDSQKDVGASISAPSLVMAQGETTGPKLECDNYDLRKEALDDTADSSIYASPLSSSPQRKKVCHFGESTGGFSVTFQPGISPSKSPTELNQSRASVGTDDKQDTTQEEERDGQYFEPVVQMPDKVDLVTGGEDEEVLYSERVELFRFDSSVSQWKKRGVGVLKILKNPTNGRFRVLMRRDWSLKVRANHWITTTMNLKPLAGSDKAWMWMANDFSDGDAKPEQLAAEFKSPEFAEEFMLTIEECQKLLLDIPLQNPHKSIDSGRTAHLIQKAEEMKSGLKDLNFFLTDDKTKITDDDSQEDVDASISAPSLVKAQGETTGPTLECDNYDLRKEALDDTADSSIYASPLSSSPQRKKVCHFGESTGGFSVTFQPGISPSKSPTELNQSRASVGTDDKQDTTQEEERDGQYFEPVVQMPDKVDLVTGGEDEEVLYSERVELFRFDSSVSQWKKRGVGVLKILKNPTNGRFRVLMRRDWSLKVRANHWITTTMNLKPLAGSDRAWMWMANDFSDGDAKPEQLAAEFKSPEFAEEFMLTIEECQKLLLDIPLQTPHKSIDSGRTAHLIQKAEEMKSGLKDLNFFLTDDKTKITDDDSQEDVDASISAPSLVMAQSETTGPKLECDNYDLRKEALDDTADSSIYASPLSSSPQRKKVCHFGESTGGFSVTFQPGISPSKSPTELNQSRASVGTDDEQDATQEEERDGQYFEPVVQMPDKVDLVTGEEDEEVLYSERVELFRFDSSVSQWKKRGVGILKILKNPTNGRFRVLMRRDWSLKVRANHWITTTMNLKPLTGSDKAWMWMANDFSDGDAKPEQLAAEFKSSELAEEFKLKFEECQKLLLDIPLQNPHKLIDSGRTAHLIQKAEEMKSGLKDLNFFLTDDKTKIKDVNSQEDVDASISAPSLVKAQGETTGPTLECDNYDLRKEALDDTADSSIYASPLASSPLRKNLFRFGESTGGFSVTFQPGISPSKSPTELNQSRASVGTDDKQGTTQEEEQDGQYFEPVVQMPDKVDLVTGGEDEEVLYSERVELFRFDSSVSQWKKRGVGILKILKNPTNGRFRVLMRRDWSLKVRANHWITTTMNLKPLAGSDRAWMWMANDFSDGDAKPEQLAAEFKSPEFAEEFMLTIEECQKLLLDIPLQTPHKSIDSGRTAHLIQKAEEIKSGLKDLNYFLTDDKTKITDDDSQEDVDASICAPSLVKAQSETTGPKLECDNYDLRKEALEDTADSSDSSPLFSSPPRKKVCRFRESTGGFSVTFQPGIIPSKSPTELNQSRASVGTDDKQEATQEEERDGQYFDRVVQMLDKMDLVTGEEDEEVLYSQRVKLFRFDSSVGRRKLRGVGILKILKNPTNGCLRVLMRRDRGLKVCTNHWITTTMNLKPLAGSDRAWMWIANDFSDGDAKPEQLVAEFKSPELAEEFKLKFEECQKLMLDIPLQIPHKLIDSGRTAHLIQKAEEMKSGLKDLNYFLTDDKTKITDDDSQEDVDASISAPSLVMAQGETTGPTLECDNYDLRKEALDDTADSSDSCPLFSGPPRKKVCRLGESTGGFIVTIQPCISPSKSPTELNQSRASVGTDDKQDATQEEERDGQYFEPVVQMPDKVDLVTGEEDEEVLYSQRIKLFRFDSIVNRRKVCGMGILKILKNPTNGRFRVLMRRDWSLKVRANHWITTTMNLKPLAGSDRAWMWMANDFSNGDAEPEQLAAEFNSPEVAEEFKLKFEECQKLLLDIPLQTPHKSIDSGRTAHLIQKAEEMKSGLKDLNFFLTDDKTKIKDDDTQEDVGASISAPSLVKAQSETTGPTMEWDNYDLRKEALDDTADSSIYDSPLFSGPPRKKVCRFGESTGGFSVTFQPGITPSKSPTELNQSRASVGTDDKQDATQEEEQDGQYFDQVVQMLDKVDLVTEEEDEEVLYSERVRLFRLDPKVRRRKVCYMGILKILKNPTNGRFRVLMRKDQGLKVCANHWITTTINLKRQAPVSSVSQQGESSGPKVTPSLRSSLCCSRTTPTTLTTSTATTAERS